MTMHIVGICPNCIEYIGDSVLEWEQPCVASHRCSGCNKTGTFDSFKVYGTLGDPGCTDCMSMTHCETHHKIEGLYPYE